MGNLRQKYTEEEWVGLVRDVTPNTTPPARIPNVEDLIEELKSTKQLDLPDGTKGAVWLDDVIEIILLKFK
jgi:hypothetical protein